MHESNDESLLDSVSRVDPIDDRAIDLHMSYGTRVDPALSAVLTSGTRPSLLRWMLAGGRSSYVAAIGVAAIALVVGGLVVGLPEPEAAGPASDEVPPASAEISETDPVTVAVQQTAVPSAVGGTATPSSLDQAEPLPVPTTSATVTAEDTDTSTETTEPQLTGSPEEAVSERIQTILDEATCAVVDRGRQVATAKFSARCEGAPVDCDKIDFMWICSSDTIGRAAGRPGNLPQP